MSSKEKKKKKAGANEQAEAKTTTIHTPSSSSSSSSTSALPEHLTRMKTHVSVGVKAPSDTSSIDAADAFSSLGIDNTFDLTRFKKSLEINVTSLSKDEMEFDLINVDASLANAFRRILIAEVPTIAIEKVRLFQNTSVIPDEVLVHRVGLLPLRVDPRLFHYQDPAKPAHEKNTLVFTLDVSCKRVAGVPSGAPASEQFINGIVMSSAFKWIPQGKQASLMGTEEPILQPDILLAKLRPGQSIEMECQAVKGIGASHSKWSPVATASYRLLPEVTLLQPIVGNEAHELVAKCPLKVFDIEDIGGAAHAKVVRPRNCSMCRECIRAPGWDQKVRLARVRDHFIFSVESTGAYTPEDLFREAVGILQSKCKSILDTC